MCKFSVQKYDAPRVEFSQTASDSRSESDMTMKHADDLLTEGRGHSPLQKLLTHSANQKAWTEQLRAAVDEHLKHQVEVSDIRGSRLVINCRSAGVATRIRFAGPELLARLNTLAAFHRVDELVIRVLSAGSQPS